MVKWSRVILLLKVTLLAFLGVVGFVPFLASFHVLKMWIAGHIMGSGASASQPVCIESA